MHECDDISYLSPHFNATNLGYSLAILSFGHNSLTQKETGRKKERREKKPEKKRLKQNLSFLVHYPSQYLALRSHPFHISFSATYFLHSNIFISRLHSRISYSN
ncbi:unnamed protein product [Lathyrus oleraceus]